MNIAVSNNHPAEGIPTDYPSRWELPILLLGYFAVRLVWMLMIPISEAPDEGAHYWMVSFIGEHYRFPDLADMQREPGSAYYGALPPLAYLPHVLFTWMLPALRVASAARLGSLFMGAVTVGFGWLTARQMFPGRNHLALAAAIILICHPQLAFVQAYTNNDAGTAAVASAIIYGLVQMIKNGLNIKNSAFMGISLGWLLMSKFCGYCLLPAIAVGIGLSAVMHHKQSSIKKLAACLVLIVALALPPALAWYLRNYFVFHDVFGVKTMLAVWSGHYHIVLAPMFGWPAINHAAWRRIALMSFWGLFGNLDRQLPEWQYTSFNVFIAGALGGWLLLLLKKSPCRNAAWFSGKGQPVVWALLAACVLLDLAGIITGSTAVNAAGPPQGRYLFPAELPIIFLLFGGLSSLPRLGKYAPYALSAFSVLCFSWATLMLYPLYGFDINPMRTALSHHLW